MNPLLPKALEGAERGGDYAGRNQAQNIASSQNCSPGLVGRKRKMKGIVKTVPSQAFRVLVVDDEDLIRYSVSKALSRFGISVDVAENGLQAKSKIKAGTFNLVITDFHMPEMNGADLLGWLKEKQPHIEGMMMTGCDLDERITSELSGLVAGFLIKPFPMAMLQEAVLKSMERFKAGEGAELERKD